jgi:hypothetical protein
MLVLQYVFRILLSLLIVLFIIITIQFLRSVTSLIYDFESSLWRGMLNPTLYDKVHWLSAADQWFFRVLRSPPPIILTVKV